MAGIILLTMVKYVTPEGYPGWMANRSRTFNGTLGILLDYTCWSPDQYPSQECLAALNSFFSANFDLRKHIFQVCLAASSNNQRAANLFKDVVGLMQGAEMNHILTIDYYIFNKYPELLRIRLIRDGLGSFNQATEFIRSKTEDETLYVKILYSKQDTSILNRNNFRLLAAAATIVAQFEQQSFQFYQGGYKEAMSGALEAVITRYLSMRMNMAAQSMSVSLYARTTEEERTRIWEDTVKEGEDVEAFRALPVAKPQTTLPKIPG